MDFVKILHIDDMSEISKVYSEILSSENHEFHSATEATKGFDMAVKNDYDVIFLDIVMPGYSGFDFLADLKEIRPEIMGKIVVITALDLAPEDLQELHDYGIRRIISKPVSIQKVVHDLENQMVQ